jgi:HEAT repeat protein
MIHRRTRHTLVALALATVTLALAGVAHAEAPSRESQRSALLGLLRAYEPKVDGVTLARIGPDVNSLLVEYGTAPKGIPGMRLRALAWLRWYPTKQTKQILMELAYAPKVDTTTRRVAVRALAQAFGGEVVPVLQTFLGHGDVFVREAAVYGLGDIDDPRVEPLLTSHEASEPEIAVRDAIERVLEKRRKAERAPR